MPTCVSVTSLMFCAQTVGNPLIIPEPIATPAMPAAPLSKRRRLTRAGGVTPPRWSKTTSSFMNLDSLVGRPRPGFLLGNANICRRFPTDLPPIFFVANLLPRAWLSQAGARSSPVRRRISGRDHLLFDTDAGRHGPLIFERHRRRVLKRDAGRVEERDLDVRYPPRLATGDDLADLAGNILLFNQPLVQRDVDFSVGSTLAPQLHLLPPENHTAGGECASAIRPAPMIASRFEFLRAIHFTETAAAPVHITVR